MNRDGYKDPTAEKAVAHVMRAQRESDRWQQWREVRTKRQQKLKNCIKRA